MGGCSIEEDHEFTSPLTLVLVGRTGNGKSATGNSIIGSKSFDSKRSSSGVTITSKSSTTVLENGRILDVIDTPGLFDSSVDFESIGKEIIRCLDMAKDGIHAVLVVFSVCNRFSEEEKAALSSLLTLFGSKIYNYIIVVFTGGDELEEEGKCLHDFLSDYSESLKETLSLCGNRYVLFDNKTKNETKKAKQVQTLLSFVNLVLIKNDGKPFAIEMFNEFKKCTREVDEEGLVLRDEQFKRLLVLVESKLKETNLKLEHLLAEERAARIEAEKRAVAAKKEADEEICRLQEEMEQNQRGYEEKGQQKEEEQPQAQPS